MVQANLVSRKHDDTLACTETLRVVAHRSSVFRPFQKMYNPFSFFAYHHGISIIEVAVKVFPKENTIGAVIQHSRSGKLFVVVVLIHKI